MGERDYIQVGDQVGDRGGAVNSAERHYDWMATNICSHDNRIIDCPECEDEMAEDFAEEVSR